MAMNTKSWGGANTNKKFKSVTIIEVTKYALKECGGYSSESNRSVAFT